MSQTDRPFDWQALAEIEAERIPFHELTARQAQILDQRAFIKFVKHHQQSKRPSRSATNNAKRPFEQRIKRIRRRAAIHPAWDGVTPAFGCEWLIVRRPEGYGKSSLVKLLTDKGRRVVFCMKSNLQLKEQEGSFRSRWPELRIVRYVSKEQHLSDAIEAVTGKPFRVTNYESPSPYAPPVINVSATKERLAELVGTETAERIFNSEYVNYTAPAIDGLNQDIIMMTISAFQALCVGFKRLWWEHLGLKEKNLSNWHKAFVPADEDPYNPPKRKWKCARGVVVMFDDPDKSDFDWFRPVIAEDVDDLAARVKTKRNVRWQPNISEYVKTGQVTGTWIHSPGPVVPRHQLVKRWGIVFERRQEVGTLGFGLWRKAGSSRPMVVVLTTELVTAALARQTFKNLIESRAARQVRDVLKDIQDDGGPTIENLTLIERRKRFAVSDWTPPTDESHVTLIYTPIVRKRNQPALIPIVQELRDKFPGEDVTFIGNGLACDWNLSNTRGINSLSEKATIIKLSCLHPMQSMALMAHFDDAFKPKDAVMGLLADQANQALGRNQGHRFMGKPAILLCDPRYIGLEQLLRYQLTPWSSRCVDLGSLMRYHPAKPTPLEEWLKHRLHTATQFAMSQLGEHYAAKASPQQQRIFDTWRHHCGSPCAQA